MGMKMYEEPAPVEPATHRMRTRTKFLLLILLSILSLLLGIGVGSVFVSPADILAIFANRLWGAALPQGLPESYVAMVVDMRLPRVLMAFLTGAALSVCGAVMQSVLRNPLASPFGLGVSSGAGLGAALVIVCGVTATGLGTFLLPAVSLLFAMGTIALVLLIASRLDRGMSDTSIILAGMVLSLFFNAIMNLLATTSATHAQRIQLWMLGSFNMQEWSAVWVLLPVTVLCSLLFLSHTREMDVMTFGEEQAMALGVDMKRCKTLLLMTTALLTGTAVAFVGVIGFIDLVAPHVARRLFGAAHRRVLPASLLFGGSFMVLCDLLARTLVPAREIPIGAVTALLGAPFFFYLYIRTRRKEG